MKLRGFTLIEILVAVLIVTLILIGSATMATRYLYELTWDRLFDRIERHFLDVNTYALAGFSVAYAEGGEDVGELPEMYHLYIESGTDPTGLWYIESRQRPDGTSSDNRLITHDEFLDLDVWPLELQDIILEMESDLGTTRTDTAPNALISWSNPFSQLSFRLYPNQLLKDGDGLKADFDLTTEEDDCKEHPKICTLTLNYIRPNTTQLKSMVFDLQKGMTRDFY